MECEAGIRAVKLLAYPSACEVPGIVVDAHVVAASSRIEIHGLVLIDGDIRSRVHHGQVIIQYASCEIGGVRLVS